MYAALSGGTGTPKLLMGLQHCMESSSLDVIANTGEDTWHSATYLSPDVDSVVYALAGIIDTDKWYGIGGDTFATHDAMTKLGHKEMLRMGDRDRATKLYRTMRLAEGASLSDITARVCSALGVGERVHPMSDDRVSTRILTPSGELAFHDFWVRDRGRHQVTGVRYEGCERASCSPGARDALERCDTVLIGPSNPVTSIGPILSLPQVRGICKDKRVVVVSPMKGDGAYSGPAPALMRGVGVPPTSLGVAMLYRDIADEIVIDREDAHLREELSRMGLTVHITDITMKDLYTQNTLGRYIRDILVK